MESKISRYIKTEKLGEGTYGIVYKAIDKVTNKIVAVKVMRLDEEDEGVASTTLREVGVLKKMHHPNIVSLVDTFVHEQQLTIVLEFLQSDIRKYLKKSGNITKKLLKSYSFQLLAGVYYLHTHRVIHRDIKPENLLIDQNGFLKICDFGLSRFFTIPITRYTEDTITLWYRPPELLLHNPIYDVSADMWSVGCVIGEMATRKALFPGDSVLDEIHKIFTVLGTPDNDLCQEFHDLKDRTVVLPHYNPIPFKDVVNVNDVTLLDLLQKLLVIDPKKRLTAKEALKHPYFNEISDAMRRTFLPPDF